jgi:hypothetical protein
MVTAQETSATLANATLVGDEMIITPHGIIEPQDNYPTDESSKLLFDTMDLQLATQAYIWSTPLVSFTMWRDQQNEQYGPNTRGTFAVYASYQEKKGVFTGNLTTHYIIGFDALTDLKKNDDGSVDLFIGPEAPAGFEGNWMKTVDDDGWFVYFRL